MTAAPLIPDLQRTVHTQRFGPLLVDPEALLETPDGLPGFEELRQFVLLPVRDDLAWFQSAELPALAFLMIRTGRVDAEAWPHHPDAWAIVTLEPGTGHATANLLAPVLIDRAAGTAHQRITTDPRWTTAHPVTLDPG
jgi:flagellar assembly factor FliW